MTKLILAILLAASVPAVARERGFSFRDAEFLSDDAAGDQAAAFVATALPPGLPLIEARARLAKAAMPCRSGAGPTIVCDMGMLVHIDGGLLGEDHWRVRLTTDASARLIAATVDHYIVGTGVPGLH